jgi:HK97 family phage major capsid protein
MRQGVEMRIEQDIISGTGASGRMSGLTKSGNYTAFTPVSGDTPLDSINRAKVALSSANFNANLIIMNPADVGTIERAKTTTNEYIIGDPSAGGLMTLWGISVYVSNFISAGSFIMMDSSSTALWMRQEIDVRFTESNEDDFVRNIFTARAEARAGLGVLLPAGIRYGALSV